MRKARDLSTDAKGRTQLRNGELLGEQRGKSPQVFWNSSGSKCHITMDQSTKDSGRKRALTNTYTVNLEILLVPRQCYKYGTIFIPFQTKFFYKKINVQINHYTYVQEIYLIMSTYNYILQIKCIPEI